MADLTNNQTVPTQLLIGGSWVDASGGATFVRPGEALGEVLGETGVEDGRLTCSVIVDCGLSL